VGLVRLATGGMRGCVARWQFMIEATRRIVRKQLP
jgi:hypothetical protein